MQRVELPSHDLHFPGRAYPDGPYAPLVSQPVYMQAGSGLVPVTDPQTGFPLQVKAEEMPAGPVARNVRGAVLVGTDGRPLRIGQYNLNPRPGT